MASSLAADALLLQAAARLDCACARHAVLELGASADAADVTGASALMHASLAPAGGALVRCLLELRARTDLADPNGVRALHCAVGAANLEAVEALLTAGAHVDVADGAGVRPLMQASLEGNVGLVRSLLRAEADPSLADEGGATALMRASARGHEQVARALLEACADTNAAELEDGATALHTAAVAGHHGLVALLLRYGARVDATDSDGCTPLDLAEDGSTCTRLLQAAEAAVSGLHLGGDKRPVDTSRPDTSPVSHMLGRDGGVLKTVLRPGDGSAGLPIPGSVVRVSYRGSLLLSDMSADGEEAVVQAGRTAEGKRSAGRHPAVVDEPANSVLEVKLASDTELNTVLAKGTGGLIVGEEGHCPSGMVAGLHVAVATMSRGEIARVFVRAEYAYGKGGCAEKAIPPGATLHYMLELLDWRAVAVGARALSERQERRALEDEDSERLVVAARSLKERGVQAFHRSEWGPALTSFQEAVELLERAEAANARSVDEAVLARPDGAGSSMAAMFSACLLNAAQCHLKLGQPSAAATCCTRVIGALTPKSAKAFYRRAIARQALGESAAALCDAVEALRIEPQNTAVRKLWEDCRTATEAARRIERERATRMLAGVAATGDDGAYAAMAPASAWSRSVSSAAGQLEADEQGIALTLSNEEQMARAKADALEGNLVMDAESGRVVRLTDEEMGGRTSTYTWSQNEKEVSLTVHGLPHGTRPADVEVRTKSDSIAIRHLGRPIVEGRLHRLIVSDETVYALEEEQTPPSATSDVARPLSGPCSNAPPGCVLTVTLTKLEPTRARKHWRCVVEGEAEIDPAAFGMPVLSFHENNPSDISEYFRLSDTLKAHGASRKLRKEKAWLEFDANP